MMKAQEWTPQLRGFKKTCPICQGIFIGRKNKVYCTLACKNRYHNDTSAEKRFQERELSKDLVNNERIFRKLLADGTAEYIDVSLQVIQALGFSHEGPITGIKDNDGNEWFKVGNYAYRINYDQQLMRITKVK